MKQALLVVALFVIATSSLHAAEPAVLSAAHETPQATLEARCTRAFGDHAVFQQGMAVPVWGWSLPQAEVEVRFASSTKKTTAGPDGAWRVTLDPMPADKLASVNDAPAGHTLTITTRLGGKEATKAFSDILIGEVWLCSGQSNMAGKFGRAVYPPGSDAEANYPALRNLESEWTLCAPNTIGSFSRVAVSFARELQRELLVPVGLMATAVGGTQIESWIRDPWVDAKGEPVPVKYRHYETKIEPLVGYAMRGAIWYQGEGNVKDKRNYLPKMQRLISGWREAWGQGDFSFYFVQLAPIGESPTDQPAGGDGRAEIRQAQFEALAIPNTGMAVTMDIGAPKEHPINKHDIGLRLACLALHRDYGRKDIMPSGPLYKSHTVEGSMVRVSFDHAAKGLMLAAKNGYEAPKPTPGDAIPWLSIQSKDGTWHRAEGRIDGSELVVSSKDVPDPIAVRYAYTENPVGFNLYNTDGLPASPFTTCGYGTMPTMSTSAPSLKMPAK